MAHAGASLPAIHGSLSPQAPAKEPSRTPWRLGSCPGHPAGSKPSRDGRAGHRICRPRFHQTQHRLASRKAYGSCQGEAGARTAGAEARMEGTPKTRRGCNVPPAARSPLKGQAGAEDCTKPALFGSWQDLSQGQEGQAPSQGPFQQGPWVWQLRGGPEQSSTPGAA